MEFQVPAVDFQFVINSSYPRSQFRSPWGGGSGILPRATFASQSLGFGRFPTWQGRARVPKRRRHGFSPAWWSSSSTGLWLFLEVAGDRDGFDLTKAAWPSAARICTCRTEIWLRNPDLKSERVYQQLDILPAPGSRRSLGDILTTGWQRPSWTGTY